MKSGLKSNARLGSWMVLVLAILVVGCNGSNKKSGSGASLSEKMAKARAIEDPRDRAEALTKIGVACVATQDKLGAKNSLREAARAANDIDVETNPADRALAYASLAIAWHKAADRDACKKARRKAESAADQVQDPLEKSEVLIQLAQLKVTLDDLAAAADQLKAAEEVSEQIADSHERTLVLTRIAHGYAQAKDADESQRVIDAAIALAQAEESVSSQCQLLVLVGREQFKSMGDKAGGKATLDKALEVARSIGDNKNLQANRLIDVAECYIEVGQRKSAKAILTEAEALAEGRSEAKPARDRIERLRGKL